MSVVRLLFVFIIFRFVYLFQLRKKMTKKVNFSNEIHEIGEENLRIRKG